MKSRGNKICILVSLLFFLVSCKKEEVSVFSLSVSPDLLIFSTTPGALIDFSVSGKSDKPLKKFIIQSKSDNQSTVTILDSALSGQTTLNYSMEYLMPQASSDYSILLTFKLQEETGLEKSVSRLINVVISSNAVTEFTGLTMYSKNSEKTDAYNLLTMDPLFSEIASADQKDIQVSSDYDTSFTLSRSWISPAGGKFVSFSGFDYANATKQSLEDAFNSGIKLDKISNIQDDDIIITRIQRSNSVEYGAIKIIYVIDADSSKNDRFIFSLKR